MLLYRSGCLERISPNCPIISRSYVSGGPVRLQRTTSAVALDEHPEAPTARPAGPWPVLRWLSSCNKVPSSEHGSFYSSVLRCHVPNDAGSYRNTNSHAILIQSTTYRVNSFEVVINILSTVVDLMKLKH